MNPHWGFGHLLSSEIFFNNVSNEICCCFIYRSCFPNHNDIKLNNNDRSNPGKQYKQTVYRVHTDDTKVSANIKSQDDTEHLQQVSRQEPHEIQ